LKTFVVRRQPHQQMRALHRSHHATTMTGMKMKVVHEIS
jgi:hypothetical protein